MFLFCLFILLNTDERFGSDAENEDTSTHTCHPHFKACGKDSSISCGVKRHQRSCSVEKCSEESAGPAYCEQSSSATEEQQRHILMDSDEKPKLSCILGKGPGHVSVHQCNNTGEKPFSCTIREVTPSHKRNTKVCERTNASEECYVQDQNLDGKQSSSLSTEAELHQTKRSAPYQTVCRNIFCRNSFYNIMQTFAVHLFLCPFLVLLVI